MLIVVTCFVILSSTYALRHLHFYFNAKFVLFPAKRNLTRFIPLFGCISCLYLSKPPPLTVFLIPDMVTLFFSLWTLSQLSGPLILLFIVHSTHCGNHSSYLTLLGMFTPIIGLYCKYIMSPYHILRTSETIFDTPMS